MFMKKPKKTQEKGTTVTPCETSCEFTKSVLRKKEPEKTGKKGLLTECCPEPVTE